MPYVMLDKSIPLLLQEFDNAPLNSSFTKTKQSVTGKTMTKNLN